ncbi:potassium-transporting ATPase subunit KdpC [Streptomyces radicis]|uniref:Potassium-transporting ATPase KdpC subunit n=2 Tax=Streptomyces radicis TaxID=1750517 RepID=A0A3A9W1Z1_9ACTN|nr:potassium-transporting ATPase subunit KdpC [Streptomyces radicis]RKN06869.1 potassium-transporting ATPase subunit KdpC [Streptomyces radicis]RKN19487.1 potassium-transporting ATPase subunit KdpC [Streptomyces radicis]
MSFNPRVMARPLWAALRALLVLTLVTGVIYPAVITGVAQAAFSGKANGSMVEADGREVGSELIGQTWNDADGDPDPRWFQPRPSHSGYDPGATGSGQLGASDPTLVETVAEARRQVATFNGVREDEVPPDAVTGSGSAVDPHISPEYAAIQTHRVAEANDLSADEVAGLVEDHIEGRDLGFLGNERVNVLALNLALRELAQG